MRDGVSMTWTDKHAPFLYLSSTVHDKHAPRYRAQHRAALMESIPSMKAISWNTASEFMRYAIQRAKQSKGALSWRALTDKLCGGGRQADSIGYSACLV